MKPSLWFGILLLSGLPAVSADVAELMQKGDALDQKLKTKEALQTFLEAEKASPPNAELLHRIAREYGLSMNDVASKAEKQALGVKALDYAKRAVAADPKNATAHLAVAVSYGRLAPLLDNKTKIGYSKLVKEEADRALALDPKNDLTYHVLGAWNYELANLNPVLRSLASMLYGSLPSASNQAAVENFKKAVVLNPHRLANHVELGRALLASGDKAGAEKELQTGLGLPSREKDDEESKRRAKAALAEL